MGGSAFLAAGERRGLGILEVIEHARTPVCMDSYRPCLQRLADTFGACNNPTMSVVLQEEFRADIRIAKFLPTYVAFLRVDHDYLFLVNRELGPFVAAGRSYELASPVHESFALIPGRDNRATGKLSVDSIRFGRMLQEGPRYNYGRVNREALALCEAGGVEHVVRSVV